MKAKKVMKIIGALLLCGVLWFVVSAVRFYSYTREEKALKNYLEGLNLQNIYIEKKPKKVLSSDTAFSAYMRISGIDYTADLFAAKRAFEDYFRTNYADRKLDINLFFSNGLEEISFSNDKDSKTDPYALCAARFQRTGFPLSKLEFGEELRWLTIIDGNTEGIEYLERCTSLEKITILDGINLTAEKVGHLKETHPGCTIIVNGEEVATAPTAADTAN